VSTFRLDRYEVTVGRFRKFVDSAHGAGTQALPPQPGSGEHPHVSGTGWQASFSSMLVINEGQLRAALPCDAMFATWTDAPGGNDNRPINCITWYEAFAFCIWDGGCLPTEAEWNYAAAGGSEQRALPWSQPPYALTNDDTSYASYWVDPIKQCFGDGGRGLRADRSRSRRNQARRHREMGARGSRRQRLGADVRLPRRVPQPVQ
jgi:formylglycine-generating enzyme required for sulfatase activity